MWRRKLTAVGTIACCAAVFLSAAETDRWWSHVRFLADDALQGRATGSDGHRQAADYVAGEFRRIGLKRGAGGSYLQPVTFRSRRIVEGGSSLAVVRNGKAEPIVLGDEASFNVQIDAAPAIEAPLVFVGHGLTIPELKIDDLAGVDLRGKVVVLITGGAPDIPGPLLAHYQAVRWDALKDAGAVGVVTIANPRGVETPWARSASSRFLPALTLDDPSLDDLRGQQLSVKLNPASADRLLAGTGHTATEILGLARAGRPLPRFAIPASLRATVTVATASVESHNVVGILPGSDRKLRNE